MNGVDLLRPNYAWTLAVAVVVLLVGARGLHRRARELHQLVAARQFQRFLPGFSRPRALVRLLLAAAGLFFLGLSALGPVRGYTLRDAKRKSLDLVLCIDTSRSMLATDLRPNRLERARREIYGLFERMKDDRCALIAFSGDAREVAPLTHDRQTLRALLTYVTPDDNRRGGTNLAAALERALTLFDGRSGAHEAVVLLTDGEDLEGRAAELAKQAEERGIRVYIVGVGTEGGSKIPVRMDDGRQGFLKGPGGEEVVTKLETASLERIARLTGGEFLSVEQSPKPLEDLYSKRISRLEGREVEDGQRRVPHDRYQWPLAVGLLCMLIESSLRERKGFFGGSAR